MIFIKVANDDTSFRQRQRWTGVNLVICWSRAFSLLGLLLPISLILPTNSSPNSSFKCLTTQLLLPLLLLHEKLALSTSVLLRYSYIYHPTVFTSRLKHLAVLASLSLLLLLLALPFLTFIDHLPPLLRNCLHLPPSLSSSPPTFLLLFLIIWLATLIADIFAYVRIINFMRLASVRINVLPDTDRERKKVSILFCWPYEIFDIPRKLKVMIIEWIMVRW